MFLLIIKSVIFLDLNLEKAKFLRNFHPDKITVFDKNHKIYYIKNNVDYILVIKKI